jgi:starch phosphorylase
MVFKRILVCPKYPESLQNLFALAQNLWCSWNYEAINLFYRIDAELFRKINHNPVQLLHSLSREKIQALSQDKGFLFEVGKLWEKFQEYLQYGDTSEDRSGQGLRDGDVVAYFSMEFGLHECIPIYSGGLGVLAGDILKGASDLGLPMVGVGLIYKYGYFTQRIDPAGRQQEVYVKFENHLLPIKELRGQDGEQVFVYVPLKQESVKVKLWQIDVGKTRLILLDTDIEDNPTHLREITDELYVADREKRLQQELVLGLGGVKALEVLGIEPKVYHINEGHSAFLILARLEQLTGWKGLSFSQARAVIRSSTVFTTHTPVIAGNENFRAELVQEYLEPQIKALGISFADFIQGGVGDGKDDLFWLPALAMRFSRHINSVSRQHRDTSRKMWGHLFGQAPVLTSIPIDYITNGVHRCWISEPFSEMFNRYIGPEYIHCGQDEQIWKSVADIPDEEVWHAHRRNKQDMVNFIRKKLAGDVAIKRYSGSKMSKLSRRLNPEHLTVVFARRFAAYKRPILLLQDPERLKKILTHPHKPVQLIFAGKAHPADEKAKQMLREIIGFSKQPELEDRFIFLENHDINVARHLIWGADVWLNVPQRDMEASGTSGMKAAMNGVLHLSTLEGWWPEAYNGSNGWAIGSASLYPPGEQQDAVEAAQIYELLEDEITEMYYERNDVGVPERWVRMMKEAVYSVCRDFNMNRVLSAYLAKFYVPAKEQTARLLADGGKLLNEFSAAEAEVLKYWSDIKLTHFATSLDKQEHVSEGQEAEARCGLYLGEAPARILAVELFYITNDRGDYKVIPMELVKQSSATAEYACRFQIEGYGLQDMNVRVRPANPIVSDVNPELVKWKE